MRPIRLVCLVGVLIVAALSVLIESRADSPVLMPPGVTMLFDGQNVGIRVFVQCDDARHNLVYASASALVVLKGAC